MRCVVFVDYSYFAAITLSELKSAEWLVQNIKSWTGQDFAGADWLVNVYDAQFDSKHRAFVPPRLRYQADVELKRIAKSGCKLRLGEYALRFQQGGRMTKFHNPGEPFFVQKGVDSLLVVDAMRELYGGAECLFFITNDRDFIPLFKEIVGARKRRRLFLFFSAVAGESEDIISLVGRDFVFDISNKEWLPSKVRSEREGSR